MVNKDGEDIYFHSGAKILIKGPFGFAWMGEKLQPGQVDHIFRSVASDRKIMEFEEHGEVDFSLGVPNLGASAAPPSASAARPHWCSATCAARSPRSRSSVCPWY
jgi:Tfp pilus assembly ATPase PilU